MRLILYFQLFDGLMSCVNYRHTITYQALNKCIDGSGELRAGLFLIALCSRVWISCAGSMYGKRKKRNRLGQRPETANMLRIGQKAFNLDLSFLEALVELYGVGLGSVYLGKRLSYPLCQNHGSKGPRHLGASTILYSLAIGEVPSNKHGSYCDQCCREGARCLPECCPLLPGQTRPTDQFCAVVDRFRHIKSPVFGREIVFGGMA